MTVAAASESRERQPGRPLDRACYLELRDRLDFTPSSAAGVFTLGATWGLALLGVFLLSRGDPFSYAASQLIFPTVFFRSFAILHECGHGSFSRFRTVNTWVGHSMSMLAGMPYFPWKYQHTQHHAWSGHLERDPGLKVLRRWREQQHVPLVPRLAWRSWIPLPALIQHVVFWSYPITAAANLTRSQKLRCWVSILFALALLVCAKVALPDLLTLRNLAPALIIYLVLVELVNLPHHLDRPTTDEKLPLWHQASVTRTCVYPAWAASLFVLNFNLHIEHHLFPTLPWYRLPRARELARPALGADYEESIGFEWNVSRRSVDFERVLLAPEGRS